MCFVPPPFVPTHLILKLNACALKIGRLTPNRFVSYMQYFCFFYMAIVYILLMLHKMPNMRFKSGEQG